MTSMVVSAVQTGNVWQPNMLMLYWVARRLQERLNGQNVLQRLIKCSPSFKYYWTWSNAIKQSIQTGKCLVAKQCSVVFFLFVFSSRFFYIGISHLTYRTYITYSSCLIAKHFPFKQGFIHFPRAARTEKILFCTRSYRGIKGLVWFSRVLLFNNIFRICRRKT